MLMLPAILEFSSVSLPPWMELTVDGAIRPKTCNWPWWVIHTRPRCEKKVDSWLAKEGFEHYVPLRRVLRTYRSKQVERSIPLFTGYAFGAFPKMVGGLVYGSGHAARLLEVSNQEIFLTQLASVHRILASGVAVQPCAYYEVGKQVKIHGGALKGLSGIIKRLAGKTKLIVSVDLLHTSVAIEIDQAWLSPEA